MKYVFVALVPLIFSTCTCRQQFDPIRIQENDKYGFLDMNGKYVIHPKFIAAGDFSEGLAPVRIGGYYGFVNANGQQIIPPKFDFAESFSEGLALVYKNEKGYFINKEGRKLFDCPYKNCTPFHRGSSVVTTISGNQGVIDTQGKLFIDTIYAKIDTLDEFFIAKNKFNKNEHFGRYGQPIQFNGNSLNVHYSDGYFHVFRKCKSGFLIDFYDKKQRKKAHLRLNNNYSLDGLARNGMLRLIIHKSHGTEGKLTDDYGHSISFFDIESGKKMRKKFIEATDFSENRSFIITNDGSYRMIDRIGRIRSKHRFSSVQPFKNGLAIVVGKYKTGVIDTNGRYVIKPRYLDIIPMKNNSNYFYFKKINRNDYNTYFGILRKDGTIIYSGSLEEVDYEGFVNNLLIAYNDKYKVAINTKGKVVWKSSLERKNKRFSLNIDYRKTAIFFAQNEVSLYSSLLAVNQPFRLRKKFPIPANQLSLYVDTSSHTRYEQTFPGKDLYLVNKTKSPLSFSTIGNLMRMKVQAKDPKGIWRDIEKYPESWCGSSYQEVNLLPDYCWHFATPVFEGCFKTQLRVVMDYYTQEPGKKRKNYLIISNPYSGSVNPGQFWRIPDYSMSNIMESIY